MILFDLTVKIGIKPDKIVLGRTAFGFAEMDGICTAVFRLAAAG
jgi:hypothetical protein